MHSNDKQTQRAREVADIGSTDLSPQGGASNSTKTALSESQAATLRNQASDELRSILDSAHEAFVAMSSDGRITDWNRQAEATFGWRRDEAVGKLLCEILIPRHYREAYLRELQHFEQTREASWLNQEGLELAALRRNGQEFPVEVTISIIQSGKSHFFSGFARDISARKHAEQALVKITRELARSNEELEQFAYVASHELQEPLRTVASYVQLLALEYGEQLDERAQKFIAVASNGTRRMQVLINDLLAYSRVGSHGNEFGPVDCGKVVETVSKSLEVAIQECQAALRQGWLPTVMGDETQLTQLFQNLLSNALKFRGQERPEISFSAERTGAQWRFAIRDNGIGIDPKYHERIFVVFQRLHRRGEYPGTGIGLAICKRVVEWHGGRIWVESAPGKGATFYFTLPALAEAAQTEAASLAATPA